jgi:hypothetical protein
LPGLSTRCLSDDIEAGLGLDIRNSPKINDLACVGYIEVKTGECGVVFENEIGRIVHDRVYLSRLMDFWHSIGDHLKYEAA